MKKYENNFKSRIPGILKNSNLSRAELGEKYFGASESSLYRWLNGEWPPLEVLLKIAKEENTNISYLLGITDADHELTSYEANLDLGQRMKDVGTTAKKVAETIGTSARIINEYVTEPRYSRIATLVQIALAMQVSIDYLLGLTPIRQWDLLLLDDNPFYLCKAGKPAYIFRVTKNGKIKKPSSNKKSQGEGFCLVHSDGKHVIFPSGDIVQTNDSLFLDSFALPVEQVPSQQGEPYAILKTKRKAEKSKRG